MVAVAAGKLQSLVPATSGNVGSTYLRQLYYVIHDMDTNDMILPRDPDYYLREANMTDGAWFELEW